MPVLEPRGRSRQAKGSSERAVKREVYQVRVLPVVIASFLLFWALLSVTATRTPPHSPPPPDASSDQPQTEPRHSRQRQSAMPKLRKIKRTNLRFRRRPSKTTSRKTPPAQNSSHSWASS